MCDVLQLDTLGIVVTCLLDQRKSLSRRRHAGILTLYQYAVSSWKTYSDKQWRIPMAIQMIPGGLLLIGESQHAANKVSRETDQFQGMTFQKESPRYLIAHDRQEEAATVLSRIRGLPASDPFVSTELREISDSVRLEKSAVAGSSVLSLVKEIASVPSNRRRYIMALTLQIFQQM